MQQVLFIKSRNDYVFPQKQTWIIGTGTWPYDPPNKLDYTKIQIFVKTNSEAEWIQLANYAGTTPLKICVPQTVQWAIECAAKPGTVDSPKSSDEDYQNAGRSIGSAYPSFMNWVREPAIYFWDKNNQNSVYLFDETQLQ